MIDVQGIFNLYRQHFSNENETPAGGEPKYQRNDDEIYFSLSGYDEVRKVITRVKKAKAAGAVGIPAIQIWCRRTAGRLK